MEILLVLAGLFILYVIVVTVVGIGIWLFGLVTTILLYVLSPFIKLSVFLLMRAFELIVVLIAVLKHLLYFGSISHFWEGYAELRKQIEEDYLIETGQISPPNGK